MYIFIETHSIVKTKHSIGVNKLHFEWFWILAYYSPAKEERRTSLPKVEPFVIERPSNSSDVTNDIAKRSINDYDVTADYGRIDTSRHTHDVTKERFKMTQNFQNVDTQQRSWKPEVPYRGKIFNCDLFCNYCFLKNSCNFGNPAKNIINLKKQ